MEFLPLLCLSGDELQPALLAAGCEAGGPEARSLARRCHRNESFLSVFPLERDLRGEYNWWLERSVKDRCVWAVLLWSRGLDLIIPCGYPFQLRILPDSTIVVAVWRST